jgi:diguanylate cyclase (GGDEF)-like protein
VILDPAGRTASDVCAVAQRAGIAPVVVGDARTIDVPKAAAVLLPAASAEDVASLPSSVPRWLYGDLEGSAKLASAAITCTAAGVVLLPTRPEIMQLLVAPPPPHLPEVDLARARSLIAASVLDGHGEPTKEGLGAIARAFAADDCVLWWREGEGMVPWGTRPIADADQGTLGVAARIAAATGLTVLAASARRPLAVSAAPLSTGPQAVGGLLAVVADRARRFSPGELADLRALATRLPRELTFRAGHRRLIAEHERLTAGAQTDPLTGSLTRGAFEQEVASAIADATRRKESLGLTLFDVCGLRKVNLERGHKAGDAVLAAIAARIKAHVRGNDRVGRFGGDELAILYIGTDTGRAQQAARKLAQHIAATPIPTSEGDVTVQVRGAVTQALDGERSGEAAFARLRNAIRGARPGAVVVAGNGRPADSDAAFDDAAAGVTTGTTLGGTYRILHELSRGAMGVVYRGEDLGLARPVAIKVLRSDLASDAMLVAKFRAEAAMLASLHHTNLVQVYSLGEHQGDVYFVMELVEGQALAEVMDTQHNAGQWLPFEAIAQIALEIGDALDAMHQIGLIHRDVKPANVLLDRERDRAVLVDVGVAKRRGDEVDGAGTPGYAAPESFLEGSSESPETDVYGLAATMFCALTGKPPFGSGQLMQVITRQLHDPLLLPSSHRPTLSRAVDEVMRKALDPDQKRRFLSASSFAMALARALERAPRTGPDSEPPRERIPRPDPSGSTPPAAAAAVIKQTEVLTSSAVRPVQAGTIHPEMVRAAHFRVAGRVIAHLAGDSAVRAICESDPELAVALAPDASPMGWLPLELLCSLVERAAAQVKGKNGADVASQLMRAIGRSTMSATFARFFGADPATLGVVSMLAVLPSMWSRYHGWCKARVMKRGAGAADVIIVGACPPLAIPLCSAELAKACELAGATGVSVTEQSDGREHRFAVSWNPVPDTV